MAKTSGRREKVPVLSEYCKNKLKLDYYWSILIWSKGRAGARKISLWNTKIWRPIYIINSVDETMCYTYSLTQYHSFFRNLINPFKYSSKFLCLFHQIVQKLSIHRIPTPTLLAENLCGFPVDYSKLHSMEHKLTHLVSENTLTQLAYGKSAS